MAEDLTSAEARVVAAVADATDELVELATRLVAFDTTSRNPGDPAHDEAALQEYLGGRLAGHGAAIDIWEPSPDELAGERMLDGRIEFDGRPQLAATIAGAGGGRSLLLNGHIDAVTVEPRELWSRDPFEAVVVDGLLHGRGTADMKGGVAAMVLAAEMLVRSDVRLLGDLVVNTVTDEESTGAGGLAAVRHGVRADAGIVPEPTGFVTWVACRGGLSPTITVSGRSGHAEVPQPHWRDGGAVNAIEKMTLVIDAIGRLQDEWRRRPSRHHAYVSPGTMVPTLIEGGEWMVSYPAVCTLRCDLMYLPGDVDADGYGTSVEREVEDWILSSTAADPWLREHPPTIAWGFDVPPMEVDPTHPLVAIVGAASAAIGEPTRLGGLDSWFDAASFTLFGSTPTIGYGPRSLGSAHTSNERVPVADLVRTAQGIAVAAMRWCGVA